MPEPRGEHAACCAAQHDTVPAGLGFRCDRCHLPAVKAGGRWRHAELADAVACAIFSGEMVIEEEAGA